MVQMNNDEYTALVGTHKPGSITRIELRNFLTHGFVVMNPGPRLNMVVGANGSGKSTILNAICLGLGGDPKLLGRADDLREFIMHGKERAEILIEIQNHPNRPKHAIRRVIDRNKGSERGRGRGASTFYLNDEKCKIDDIRNLVSNEYSISIDNLCTFLPQDKVGNFSGFSDQCRLIETEKTLSTDGHLYQAHMKLIAEESEMEQSVLDVDSIQDNLNKLLHEFERLEREKELAEEREKALEQIELYQKKRIWLEFECLRHKAIDLKVARDNMKKKVLEAKREMAPLEAQYEKACALKQAMEAKHKAVEQSTQKSKAEQQKQEKKFEMHDDEIEEIMAKLSEIDSKRAKLEGYLDECQTRLAQLEQEYDSLPPKQQTMKEYDEAVQKMKVTKRDLEGIKKEDRLIKSSLKEMEDKATGIQNKLAKMNDDVARRKEKVFRERRNLGKIDEWLSKNRSMFRRPVVGPVAVEVTTNSQEVASFLEFHVPKPVLCAFVVETKEDYNMLYEVGRQELKVPINVLLVPKIKEVHRIYSKEKMDVLMQQHGIAGYLDEMFTAPDIVMQVLRDHAQVDKVLVGNGKTQQSIDHNRLLDIISETEASGGHKALRSSCVFCSKGNDYFRYSQNVSRYSKQLGSRMDQVGSAQLLAKGVDPELKKQTEQELEGVHRDIAELRPELVKTEQAVADLESEFHQATLRTKGTKQALESWEKFEAKLDRQRAKVEEAKSDLQTDDSKEKNGLVKSLLGRLTHAVSAMETHAKQQKELLKLYITNTGITVNKTAISTAERIARDALAERKQAYNELENEARKVQQEFQAVKQKATAKMNEAQRIAPLQDENGNDLPLKEVLNAIDVSDLPEVDAAIEEIERAIEGIHENPDAIRQYEKLKVEIEKKKESLELVRNSKETKEIMIAKIREPWENRLVGAVEKINALFTEYMAEMGCTGEVRLKKPDKQNGGFKEWGIEILVSFRENAKAQVLSAERHSGGERSVSTILYLMALQDLMVAPFRCVDEINQGLDDRNERLVFKRIVTNSTKKPAKSLTDHAGQYFLITPKLLPNLTDMEEHAVTIQFVYNGIYNFKHPKDCDFSNLLDSRSKRSNDTDDDKENTTVDRKSKKKRKS